MTMNHEQLAYLKSLFPNADEQRFRAFARDPNVQAILAACEAQVAAAWHMLGGTAPIAGAGQGGATRAVASEAYRKMQFPDFRAQSVAPPVPRRVITLQIAKTQHPPQPGFSQQAMAAATPAPARLPDGGPALAQTRPTVAALSPVIPPGPAPAAAADLTSSTPAEPPRNVPPARPTLRFVVRNARQGEPYEGEIQCEPKIAGLRLLDLKLPDDAGLQVALESWRIGGTPAISGEFAVGLRYAFPDEPAAVSYAGTLQFVINADPKTLWKDLPSDTRAPFWKEDTATGVCIGPHAKIVAARKRGRSHAHKGTCCDDDYFTVCDDAGGWHLAVVADGAGSAKFSRRGSHIVTRSVGSYMKGVFDDERSQALAAAVEQFARSSGPASAPAELAAAQHAVRNMLFKTLGYAAYDAVKTLHAEAAAMPGVIASPKELSTTLLIGLARKVGARWFCAAYWVGDGAVAVYRRTQEVCLLGTPDGGEFSGQTRFLDSSEVTQDALVRRLSFRIVDDMTAFILMTDGVSDPKFHSESQLEQIAGWDRLWDDIDAKVKLDSNEEGHEARLLEWLDFWSPGEYDDRTIAIIY